MIDKDLYKLHTWFQIYSYNSPEDISCKLYIPNPQYLGIEKSLEICEFIESELNHLLNLDKDYPLLLLNAIESSLFIIRDNINKIK
jgi:hypothetical protein